MIRLQLQRGAAWLDLLPGLRLLVLPPSTSVIAEARSDARVVAAAKAEDSQEALGLAFAKAVAERAILEWEGVVGDDGAPLPITPAAVDALLELFPVYNAFENRYMRPAFVLDAEKNGSGPSPRGTSAGDRNTAAPAESAAPSVPAS